MVSGVQSASSTRCRHQRGLCREAASGRSPLVFFFFFLLTWVDLKYKSSIKLMKNIFVSIVFSHIHSSLIEVDIIRIYKKIVRNFPSSIFSKYYFTILNDVFLRARSHIYSIHVIECHAGKDRLLRPQLLGQTPESNSFSSSDQNPASRQIQNTYLKKIKISKIPR